MRPTRLGVLALCRAVLAVTTAAACAAPAGGTAGGAVSAAGATSAGSAAPAGLDLARYESEIARFEAEDRVSAPPSGGIVFVGSSSFRMWKNLASDFPGLPVINRGFGGSTLPEVNHYVSRVVLPYRPRLVVVYAGDNDLTMGRSASDVAEDYRTFVRLVHAALPSARIAFVSLKPSPSRWSLIGAAREANRLVRSITANDSRQSFVDVFTPMLGADGRPRPELFLADSLHMTPAGYVIWRRQLAPVIR